MQGKQTLFCFHPEGCIPTSHPCLVLNFCCEVELGGVKDDRGTCYSWNVSAY